MSAFLELENYRVSMHRHYYRICMEQKKLYDHYDSEINQLCVNSVQDENEYSTLAKSEEYYEKREQAAVIGIAFAALCLEAFFYDYAATKLGDDFVKEHLDKLDLPSKLLIIPTLVCGKGIMKSSHVYEHVKRLSKERNYLVHFKSKSFRIDDLPKASDFHEELSKMFRLALINGTESIELVLNTLDELHGKGRYYWSMVCI